MVNYNNSLIYKLCCKDTSIKDIYIGSTTNFIRRKYNHKNCCINENMVRSYNLNVYKIIRKNGGWENWDMILVKNISCKSKLELHKIEREYIDKLKPTLNMAIPTRTHKEYRKDNREELNKKHKEWLEKNKENEKKKNKIYREKNKEKEKLRGQKYREEHNKIIKCECGCFINERNLKRHKKTKKHLDLLKID